MPWGWEVTLPQDFNNALIGRSNMAAVSEWAKLGIKPVRRQFQRAGGEAFVMVPQGLEGPVFLVTQNFMAIMDYNQSHSYAVAVGHLATASAARARS